MAEVNANIQIGKFDSTWFVANASSILLDGQPIFNETTSELFIGDGVTALSGLTAINATTASDLDALKRDGSNANSDVDLGSYALNAKSFKANGTNGNGHYSMKHQSSNATASASETVIFAGNDGEMYYKNDGNAVQQFASRAWVGLQGFIINVVTALGYTPENVSNKSTSYSTVNNTLYPTLQATENRYSLKQSQLNSGGTITIGTFGGSGSDNDIRVAAANWFVQSTGLNYSTSIDTDFLDITPAASGQQRYIGLYGTTSNTITKVEGTDAVLATYPTQPANTALIGYVLVTDAAIGTTPDLSGYLLKADKATASEVSIGTNDTKYLTPKQLNDANTYAKLTATQTLTNKRITARVSTTASSATPTPNADTDDEYTVTVLAAAATFGAPTGTPTEGQVLLVRVKDNGTARALLFNSIYRFSTDLAAPTTTVINKTLYMIFVYNNTDNKWDCINWINNF